LSKLKGRDVLVPVKKELRIRVQRKKKFFQYMIYYTGCIKSMQAQACPNKSVKSNTYSKKFKSIYQMGE
jgi:hypothetical protein